MHEGMTWQRQSGFHFICFQVHRNIEHKTTTKKQIEKRRQMSKSRQRCRSCRLCANKISELAAAAAAATLISTHSFSVDFAERKYELKNIPVYSIVLSLTLWTFGALCHRSIVLIIRFISNRWWPRRAATSFLCCIPIIIIILYRGIYILFIRSFASFSLFHFIASLLSVHMFGVVFEFVARATIHKYSVCAHVCQIAVDISCFLEFLYIFV